MSSLMLDIHSQLITCVLDPWLSLTITLASLRLFVLHKLSVVRVLKTTRKLIWTEIFQFVVHYLVMHFKTHF